MSTKSRVGQIIRGQLSISNESDVAEDGRPAADVAAEVAADAPIVETTAVTDAAPAADVVVDAPVADVATDVVADAPAADAAADVVATDAVVVADAPVAEAPVVEDAPVVEEETVSTEGWGGAVKNFLSNVGVNMAGGIGGAAVGAGIGTIAAGPIGTAVGGLAGQVVGSNAAHAAFSKATAKKALQLKKQIESITKRIADAKNGDLSDAKKKGIRLTADDKEVSGADVLKGALAGYFIPFYNAYKGHQAEELQKELTSKLGELKGVLESKGVSTESQDETITVEAFVEFALSLEAEGIELDDQTDAEAAAADAAVVDAPVVEDAAPATDAVAADAPVVDAVAADAPVADAPVVDAAAAAVVEAPAADAVSSQNAADADAVVADAVADAAAAPAEETPVTVSQEGLSPRARAIIKQLLMGADGANLYLGHKAESLANKIAKLEEEIASMKAAKKAAKSAKISKESIDISLEDLMAGLEGEEISLEGFKGAIQGYKDGAKAFWTKDGKLSFPSFKRYHDWMEEMQKDIDEKSEKLDALKAELKALIADSKKDAKVSKESLEETAAAEDAAEAVSDTPVAETTDAAADAVVEDRPADVVETNLAGDATDAVVDAPAADAPVADAPVVEDAPAADAVATDAVAADAPAATDAVATTDDAAASTDVVADGAADAVATTEVTDAAVADAISTDAGEASTDAEPAGDTLEGDLMEVGHAESEVQTASDAVDELDDVQDGLEAIAITLESSLAEGGLTPQAAQFANFAIESYTGRLGENVQMLSMESFGGHTSRVEATMESMEKVKDIIAKVWEAIKAIIGKVKEAIIAFFKQILTASGRLKARAEQVKALAAKLDGEPKKAEIELGGLASKIAVGTSVDIRKDAVEAVVNLAADALKFDAEAGEELKGEFAELQKAINEGKHFESTFGLAVPAVFNKASPRGPSTDVLPGNVTFTIAYGVYRARFEKVPGAKAAAEQTNKFLGGWTVVKEQKEANVSGDLKIRTLDATVIGHIADACLMVADLATQKGARQIDIANKETAKNLRQLKIGSEMPEDVASALKADMRDFQKRLAAQDQATVKVLAYAVSVARTYLAIAEKSITAHTGTVIGNAAEKAGDVAAKAGETVKEAAAKAGDAAKDVADKVKEKVAA